MITKTVRTIEDVEISVSGYPRDSGHAAAGVLEMSDVAAAMSPREMRALAGALWLAADVMEGVE